MSQAAMAVEAERLGRCGDPCVMVIFGAAGDLTRRKLIPSLYNLAKYNLLSREFAVIGIARNPMSTDQFRAKLVQDLKEFVEGPIDADLQEWLERHVFYITGEFADPSTYQQLRDLLQKVEKDQSPRQLLLLPCHGARFLRFDRGATGGDRPDVGGESSVAASDRGEAVWAGSGFGQSPESAITQSGQ